jgi:urease accessory protein UreE
MAEMCVFQEVTVDTKQVSSVELKVNNGHQLALPLNQVHSLDQTDVLAVDTVDTHSSVHQLTQALVACQLKCIGHVPADNSAQAEWFL